MSTSRWLMVVASLLLASAVPAQTPAAAPGEAPDPNAKALLEQSAAAYKALGSIHIRLHTLARAVDLAAEIVPQTVEVWFQRPSKVRIAVTYRETAGKVERALAVTDGHRFWQWSSDTNTYRAFTYSDAALRSALGRSLPDSELILDGSARALIAGLPQVSLQRAPPRKHGGTTVDVLALKRGEGPVPGLAFELYLRRNDHLIVGTHVSVKAAHGPPSMSMDVEDVRDVVEANPKLADTVFRFTPPAGAKLAGAATKPPIIKTKPKAKKR